MPLSSFSSPQRETRLNMTDLVETLIPTRTATSSISALTLLPIPDIGCSGGGDCYYCGCPETD
jgi:hypothetical protein